MMRFATGHNWKVPKFRTGANGLPHTAQCAFQKQMSAARSSRGMKPRQGIGWRLFWIKGSTSRKFDCKIKYSTIHFVHDIAHLNISAAAYNLEMMISRQRSALVMFASWRLSTNPGYVTPAYPVHLPGANTTCLNQDLLSKPPG